MTRIRKIPDTWTLEIHAIVLKDSRRAEHEEIGCTRHNKTGSVYSNTNAGGRGARNEKKRSKQQNTTRRARYTRTPTLVGEELETKKKRSKQQDTTRRARYTRTPTLVGEELETKRNARNNKTQQDGLSILEHQRWWEKSSKRKETLETKRHDKTGSVYSNTNAGGRRARNKKKRSKQKDTTRRSSADSTIKRGGRGARNEKKRSKQQDKTRRAQYTRTPTLVGEELETKRNARNKNTRQDEAQRTRTSNVVGEELKTKRRRCPEERKIKRLNHHGQTRSTYGSLLRPERN